jgi:hypothetical protein
MEAEKNIIDNTKLQSETLNDQDDPEDNGSIAGGSRYAAVGGGPSSMSLLANMRFEKVMFDGTDFPEWKFWFETMMMGYGLLGILEGTDTQGNTYDFEGRSNTAYVMLILCMTKITVQKLKGIKRGNARAAWLKLNEEYERNTRASRIGVRRQLYSLTNQDGLALDDVVARIDGLCARLTFLNVEVTDDEKLAVLLSCLPRTFEPMVVMIEMGTSKLGKGFKEMSYEDAVEKLKDYDTRNKGVDRDETSVALQVNRRDLSGVLCYNCQEYGHLRSNCKNPWKARAKNVKDLHTESESIAW